MKPIFVEIERDDRNALPVCPFCEKEIEGIVAYRSHYKGI